MAEYETLIVPGGAMQEVGAGKRGLFINKLQYEITSLSKVLNKDENMSAKML